MTTLRAYYDDPYTSLFSAQLLELRPDEPSGDSGEHLWRAYLDRTFFYPESGGQPFDLGTLAGFPLRRVVDEDVCIAHVIAAPADISLQPGKSVEGLVDWSRRHDHMQQHSGQHLLSAAFAELLSVQTLSFHMGEQVSTIELDTAQLADTQLDSVERRVNALVAEARPVSVSYEDSQVISGLRKASARSGILRVITIAGYDRSACGGTHVQTTAEIGPVYMRNQDRVRGHVRVEFVCGERCRLQSRQDFLALTQLARAASVPVAALSDYFAKVQTRLESTEKALAKANLLLAQAEGKRLYDETAPLPDGTRRRGLVVSELTESIRSMALAFTSEARSVVVVVPESLPGTVLLACSSDSGMQAGSLWKTAFANGGGRGGGSGTLAQGSVSDRDALTALLTAAGVEGVHLREVQERSALSQK